MPVDYPMPSWISQPPSPSPAAAYISSLHQGAQIGMEQQRLQQQAVLAQQEMQARQQERDRRDELERQQIEYDHALKTAELGMQQQKLDEAKQFTDMQIQESARRYQAQQAVQADIDAGVDPATAMFKRAADLGMHAGDIGAIGKLANPPTDKAPIPFDIGDGRQVVRLSPERWQVLPPAKPAPSSELQQATVRGQPIEGVYKDYLGRTVKQPTSRALNPEIVAKMKTIDAQRREYRSRLSNKAQFDSEVQTVLRDFHKSPTTDLKWATDYAKNNLSQRIADLDRQYNALAASLGGGGSGAGARKLRVLSITPAGQGQAISAPEPATEDLTPPDERDNEEE